MRCSKLFTVSSTEAGMVSKFSHKPMSISIALKDVNLCVKYVAGV